MTRRQRIEPAPNILERVLDLNEGEQMRLLARPGIGLTSQTMAIAHNFSANERVALLRVKARGKLISLRLLGPGCSEEPRHTPLTEAFEAVSAHDPSLILVDDLHLATREHLASLHEAAELWLSRGARIVWGLRWTESEHDAAERIPGRFHATASVPPCGDDAIHEILLASAHLSQAQLALATAACCGNPTVAQRISEELATRTLPGTTPPAVFVTKAVHEGLHSVIGPELRAPKAALFALLACLFPIETAATDVADTLGIARQEASDMCDHLAYLALLTPDPDRTAVVRHTLLQHLSKGDAAEYERALGDLGTRLTLRDPEAVLDIADGVEALTANLNDLLVSAPTPQKAKVAGLTAERLTAARTLSPNELRSLRLLGRTYIGASLAVIKHAARRADCQESRESALSALGLAHVFESPDALGPALMTLIANAKTSKEGAVWEAWALLCPAEHLGISHDDYRSMVHRVFTCSLKPDAPLFVRAAATALSAAHGVCPTHTLERLENDLSAQPASESLVPAYQLLAFVNCARGNRSGAERWLVQARSAVPDSTAAGAFTALLRRARHRRLIGEALSEETTERLTGILHRVGATRLATWSAILGAREASDAPVWELGKTHPALTASYASGRGKLLLATDDHAEAIEELYQAGRIMASAQLCPLVFGNWREPLLKYYLENNAKSAYRCIADDDFRCQLRLNRVVGLAPHTGHAFDSSLVHSDSDVTTDQAPALTAAEERVVREVIAGASNQKAARALYLSKRTVDTHLRNVYRKLGIRSRAELKELVESGVLNVQFPTQFTATRASLQLVS
ncbi:helix-turn-helix transcriptional regulator [Dermabacter sp. Marseille-Q3180]|uniref:helix-turn-helix domain-containing protein n=1 Tax=Dermabacter sp. Marseille-Q3180 TaxID=2758090 RepID=UPI002025730A|nr:helix-turn-helix transcriptional regulator [Dermabacter sp. Marseille-Q3180]